MFGTKTLSSLKDFLPQIHQPLPINRRQSQLLLKTLTTSFRNNLDKEHGYWNENTSVATGKAMANASATPPPFDENHHRPIDRHVRAILSNPLFSYDRAAHHTNAGLVRDPMDVFDEAVAKGLMTPQRAAGVLRAKRHAIMQSSSISVNESMASSGTALRVLQWLRSHGHHRDLSFVTCAPLIMHLTYFMVEEGLEEIAWVWMERLMSGEGPSLTGFKSPSPAACILDGLVRAKTSYGKSLDEGFACMVRARHMFNSRPSFNTDAISAWRALSWWSTVSAWNRSQPSETLFDAFAAMGRQLEELKTTLLVDRAHLELHHPTKPDAKLSMGYLESSSLQILLEQQQQEAQQAFQTCMPTRRYNSIVKRVAVMGIDTINHLSRLGQNKEAGWVEDVLADKFGSTLLSAFGRNMLGPGLRHFQQTLPTS